MTSMNNKELLNYVVSILNNINAIGLDHFRDDVRKAVYCIIEGKDIEASFLLLNTNLTKEELIYLSTKNYMGADEMNEYKVYRFILNIFNS